MNMEMIKFIERIRLKDREMQKGIKAQKAELVNWIMNLEDVELLSRLDAVKRDFIKSEYESSLTPMTMEDYNAKLERAMSDYKAGRVTSQEDLEEEAKDW